MFDSKPAFIWIIKEISVASQRKSNFLTWFCWSSNLQTKSNQITRKITWLYLLFNKDGTEKFGKFHQTATSWCQNKRSWSIAPVVITDFIIKLLLQLRMLLEVFICRHGANLFLFRQMKGKKEFIKIWCKNSWNFVALKKYRAILFNYLHLLYFNNFLLQTLRLLQGFLFCFFQFNQL